MAVPTPSHWQAQSRPSVSIGATSAQPQIAIRASSHPKPSAFHSHVSTCQPTIGASFQPTALNRPRTPRANFTLSHKSVLVKFSFSRTLRRALNRAARASSLAVRFTSERRKWFLPCSGCSALVPRRRAASHRKEFVYFLSQPLPRPLRSKASNPSAASDFPTAHVADHIQTHCQAQYGRQCSQPTVRHRAPTPSLLTTLPRQRLSAFRCSAHLNPQALRRPRTQPHKPTHANAPSPARHLPSPAPNHPPVGRALALSASLAPEMACFAQNLFSAGSFL